MLANHLSDDQFGAVISSAALVSVDGAASQTKKTVVLSEATGVMPKVIHLLIASPQGRLNLMLKMSLCLLVLGWHTH